MGLAKAHMKMLRIDIGRDDVPITYTLMKKVQSVVVSCLHQPTSCCSVGHSGESSRTKSVCSRRRLRTMMTFWVAALLGLSLFSTQLTSVQGGFEHGGCSVASRSLAHTASAPMTVAEPKSADDGLSSPYSSNVLLNSALCAHLWLRSFVDRGLFEFICRRHISCPVTKTSRTCWQDR